MPQVLKLHPTIEYKIPDSQLLIDKTEYDSLLDQATTGRWWTMSDLRKWIGNKDARWVKDFILYRPEFQKDFGQMERQNLIHISSGSGDSWKFKASVMSKWLDDHWDRINWNGKVKR